MAHSVLPPAKVILLAVQLAIHADVATLRKLVVQNRRALRTEVILRILLTYLPETLGSSEYVPLLLDIASGQIWNEEKLPIDTSAVDYISDQDATKNVKKLRLLPLAWPTAPPDAPEEPVILFLIHRAYRIDEATGLIVQIPELIVPFLNQSTYLRTWMISILLPLLRLHYEYHPQESAVQTIHKFETLDDWAGVDLLLSQTGKDVENVGDSHKSIGRDLRGLVGPWMYGDSRRKRRRTRRNSEWDAQTVAPLDEIDVLETQKSGGWEEVFKWVISQATISWMTCIEAIEQWDGPSDVDLGGYGDGSTWIQEEEQQRLEIQYARAALASAYLIPEASAEALTGVQRILARLIGLMDLDRIPTLPAAAALLSPIPLVEWSIAMTAKSASHLRTGLMDASNPLTTPSESSVTFLHGLLISAFILTRAGVPCTIRKTGELILLQDEKEQTKTFKSLISKIVNGPKGDDKYWIRMRNEILWLRNWGTDEVSDNNESSVGRGVFGKVKKDFVEKEILRSLLTNTRKFLSQF
jgi:hypothetical protein